MTFLEPFFFLRQRNWKWRGVYIGRRNSSSRVALWLLKLALSHKPNTTTKYVNKFHQKTAKTSLMARVKLPCSWARVFDVTAQCPLLGNRMKKEGELESSSPRAPCGSVHGTRGTIQLGQFFKTPLLYPQSTHNAEPATTCRPTTETKQTKKTRKTPVLGDQDGQAFI